MRTQIGRAFRRPRQVRGAAVFLGVAIVGLDVAIVAFRAGELFRLALALAALGAFGALARWDRDSLGWRVRPGPSWRFWGVAALIFAAIVLACSWALWRLALAAGIEVPTEQFVLTPSRFWPWVAHACLLAPFYEEVTYRFVLCNAAVNVARPWVAVLLSGFAFAGLHVLYGNPSVDNILAGFLLGWAYLRSGTLLLPALLHAAGNLGVALLRVTAPCWLPALEAIG